MSMRAIKKTSLTFGLVSVPIKLYKAVDSHEISFHQYHTHDDGSDPARIAMNRICTACEQEVPFAELVKGIESDGSVVLVSSEELKDLEEEQARVIEVLQFTDASDVDPLLTDSAYYLEPDGPIQGYALLRQALKASERVGICRFGLRGRVSLAVLRVVGNTLVLQTLHWADEVRNPAGLKGVDKEVEFTDDELAVADLLVDQMSAPFDATAHTDGYTERVQDLISTKVSGGQFSVVAKPSATEDVSDLLTALKKSLSKKL